MMKRRTQGEVIFEVVNYLLLIIVLVTCILPFVNIIAKSFSREASVLSGEVFLWPIGFNTSAYEIVMGSQRFWNSLQVSVFVTVIGTLINTLLTIFVGYALSRKHLRGKGLLMFLYVFTMLFNGGLIPTYLIVKKVGLLNSLWSLIIPNLVVPFNMIILRNYFYGIPDSLEESAKLDGASNTRTMFCIMIPLAMPSVATIALFYAVGYWNNYFEALIYINDRNLFPMQVYLREIILNSDNQLANSELMMNTAQESVRGATIVAATLPILLVYPFLQKHFVKGVMVGAVKQ